MDNIHSVSRLTCLGTQAAKKNEASKSEPAYELLIFEFRPSQGVKSAFHICKVTNQ